MAFVKDLAARSGASLARTRWDTGSLFAAVAAHAGPDLITRILHQLPPATRCSSAASNSSLPRKRSVPFQHQGGLDDGARPAHLQ
jgi:hypothetical protein